MARQTRPTLIDRKLEELRRQSELVENDIRSISKNMRRMDEGGGLPPLKSQRAERRAPAAPGPREASAAETIERAFGAVAEGDERKLRPEEPAPLVMDTKNRPLQPDAYFSKYLASGSFGRGRPLADERRIQRNKAIFMLVFAVLAAVILLRLLFK